MKRIAWDLLALLTFTLVGLACHVGWASVESYWIFCVSAVAATAALALWLRWLWPRLALWLTKFFCIAAAFDLLAEGLLQPWHHDTTANLICQMTLFAAYAIYLIVLRPIDVWVGGWLRIPLPKSYGIGGR